MLYVTLREGDYVRIGDDIRIHYADRDGRDVFALGIEAPKDVTVLRGKLYEETIRQQAEAGCEDSKRLYQKLRKEYEERRDKAATRRAKRDAQERRMESGEIKPYNA